MMCCCPLDGNCLARTSRRECRDITYAESDEEEEISEHSGSPGVVETIRKDVQVVVDAVGAMEG